MSFPFLFSAQNLESASVALPMPKLFHIQLLRNGVAETNLTAAGRLSR